MVERCFTSWGLWLPGREGFVGSFETFNVVGKKALTLLTHSSHASCNIFLDIFELFHSPERWLTDLPSENNCNKVRINQTTEYLNGRKREVAECQQ